MGRPRRCVSKCGTKHPPRRGVPPGKKVNGATDNPSPPPVAPNPSTHPPTHSPTHPSTPQFSSYNPATFAGRDSETAALMEALQHGCRIAAIVGMTGIGKTTLAERVVANLMDATETPLPYLRFSLDDRSLTPDFASSGAALLRILGDEPTLEDQQDPSNLLHHILNRFCHTPCRVQIDSLERLLRGNEQDGWSEFCDPLWLDLLQKILAMGECPSQLLLTTQDIPGELDAVGSRTPQLWHCEPLQGLSADEQRTLFQNLGLTPTAADWDILQRIGAFYDGHPLVLQVITEELRQPPFRGNIARYWQHYEAEFTASPDASGNRLDRSRLFRRRVRQRVEQSIQSLPASARQLLCACAVFRRPVPEDFWYAMLPNGDPQPAFDTLQDRHLIEYTVHPPTHSPTHSPFLIKQHNLIRAVALTLLKANTPTWQAAERQAAHLWLTEYQPAPNAPNLETVRGYLEAFDHYCEVGDWEAAKDITFIQLDTGNQLHWQLLVWSYFKDFSLLHNKLLLEIKNRQIQGKLLTYVGIGHSAIGQFEQAVNCYQKSLSIAQETSDRQGEGAALGNLGNAYNNLGQYERAIDFHQQALLISREIGDRRGEGQDLGNLGLAYHSLGQYERAIDLYQQRLTIAREIGNRRGEGIALSNLGNAYNSLGQYERAIDLYQQRLTIAWEIGDRRGEGIALVNMGATKLKLQEYPESLTNNQTALEIFQEIGDKTNESEALKNLAEVHQALGEVEVARQYAQQSLALATELGIPLKAECEALVAELEQDHKS